MRRAAHAPSALAGALLLVLLYAAFAHGAIGPPAGIGSPAAESRLEVAIAVIATLAGACLLWSGSLRFSAPRLALAGVGLLAAFAVWSGFTLLWSVAPDQTWIDLNRALTYVIALCLAVAIGASLPRAVALICKGFLLVALAVTIYALGQKLAPGLHVPGLFDLNQTGLSPLLLERSPRLQEPFGYWNALALFIAMGVPIALVHAVDATRTTRTRLGALLSLELMLLAIVFTYSRGGVLALVAATAVAVALSGARLRSLMWLAVASATTAVPLIFGLANHSLSAANMALAERETAGGELAAILLASLLVLYLLGMTLLRLERRVEVGPQQARRIGRAVLGLGGIVLAAGVIAVALSAGGLDGTVSHAWRSFTAVRGTSYDPQRLLSANSENRWVWWKEALGAFSDRPAGGWGAGSFGVVQPLYLRGGPPVPQPHSVPLQFLAETGIVGALLALGGYALLLGAGVGAVRRRALGGDRLLAGALLAGGVAYAVHACYDWDWDIPGVTLPAVLFLGVLAGAARQHQIEKPGDSAVPTGGRGVRAIALGALTLGLCTFTLSAILPSLAASKASSALVAASASSPAILQQAQARARLASRLDPLSDAGPLAEEAIALHRAQLAQAQSDLLEAIRREPGDVQPWERLALLEGLLHDPRGLARSIDHVLALDPTGPTAARLLQGANLLAAPPQDSPTATATPLSPP